MRESLRSLLPAGLECWVVEAAVLLPSFLIAI
jgi:hypothetical protein